MILALLLSFSLSHAAQNGRVLEVEATIHEAPDATSPVLNRLSQGEMVRMASRSSRGWYKVLLPQSVGSTKYGFIQVSSIQPDTAEADLNHAGIIQREPIDRESSRHPWLVRGFYEFMVLTPIPLSQRIGASAPIALGHAFGGEFGYRFDSGIFFGLRGGYGLASASATGNFSSQEVLTSLVFDYEYFFHYPFTLDAGVSLGAAYLGSITGADSDGNTIAATYPVAPEGTVRFTATYYVGGVFGFSLGLGFRALYIPVVDLAGTVGGLWMGGGLAQGSLVLRF